MNFRLACSSFLFPPSKSERPMPYAACRRDDRSTQCSRKPKSRLPPLQTISSTTAIIVNISLFIRHEGVRKEIRETVLAIQRRPPEVLFVRVNKKS